MDERRTEAARRLVRFLHRELSRDDLPPGLRREYEDRLAELGGSPAPGTAIEDLP